MPLSAGVRLLTRNGHQGGVHGFRIVARRWKSGRPFGRPVFYYSPVSVEREQPILRGTIKLALFLPGARPTFWGTPNNPRLPKKMGAVRLNPLRDVALQTIGLDASILRYRD